MDWRELNLNLIPQVGATGGDANLQPTFGNLIGITSQGSTSSIVLTASNTSTQVGQQISVDVEIKTNSFTINEYRIVVDFDPTKLQVVDAAPSTAGTQITFLDTVFQVTGTNNTVSPAGRITLIAKTPGGNALQVNRKVAKITFQAQNPGVSNIQTVTGATGSQLINQNGVAIASSVNNVSINIGNQVSSSSTNTAGSSSSGGAGSSSSGGGGSSSSGGVGQIPDTALPDDVVAVVTVLLGMGLVVLGLRLRKARRDFLS
ncbi:MAG: hypothetical protein JNK26_02830 [Candidatus Doudnabacteria bacterium]|nr:hypothetical protein [Candidatus Doudnabacteria bacterium]